MREDKLILGFSCICADVHFGDHPTVVQWKPTDKTAECLECKRIWNLETVKHTVENGGWE